VAYWYICLPYFTAQLAVHLNGYFCDHTLSLSFVVDNLRRDHLTGHGILQAADSLDSVVAILSLGRHNYDNHLGVTFNMGLESIYITFRIVTGYAHTLNNKNQYEKKLNNIENKLTYISLF
jgi:hypothetical protein